MLMRCEVEESKRKLESFKRVGGASMSTVVGGACLRGRDYAVIL